MTNNELRKKLTGMSTRTRRRVFSFGLRAAGYGHALLPPEGGTRAVEAVAIVRDYSMVSDAGLRSLYRQARFCEELHVPGAFVECGVWKGGSAGVMALATMNHGTQPRDIHLFDSFEEICEPDETVDGERAIREVMKLAKEPGTQGQLRPLTGVYDSHGGPGSVEGNRRLFADTLGYDMDHVHFHKGWFQDTLPKVASSIGPIAILRIDADWYASTKICLDYLFSKVVVGGFVVIDDYGAYEGCQKAVDEFLASRERVYYLNQVTNDIRYVCV